MKKMIRCCCFILFAVVIYSSCTVQKRRYSRGYFVDFAHRSGNRSVQSKKEKKENSQHTAAANIEKSINTLKPDSTAPVFASAGVEKLHDIKPKTKINLENTMDSHKAGSSQLSSDDDRHAEHSKTNVVKNKKRFKMSDGPTGDAKLSKRKLAIIIGVSLLLMALIAGLAVPALGGLFVSGDAALTAVNVTANFGRYIGAVAGWISIAILDLIVAFGVHKYYKKESPKKAKVTGLLRLLYTGVLGVGIGYLATVFRTAPAATIYHHISMFNKFWGLGLIVFGFHLIALGILFKNEGGKKWMTILIKSLLIIAGIGYIIQYVGILLVPDPVAFAALAESIFIVPMIAGEILYGIWKIIKGGKEQTTQN